MNAPVTLPNVAHRLAHVALRPAGWPTIATLRSTRHGSTGAGCQSGSDHEMDPHGS